MARQLSAFDTLGQHYAQRDLAPRAWKGAGGRVVGYLCDNVPEELIMAAGCLPYRVSGDPNAGDAAVQRYVQPFALPFSARTQRPPFVESMLELLVSGRYDFLDALVVPHSRKAIQAIYRELTLAHAEFPELNIPELMYLDRAYTPFYASEVFNRQRVLEFRRSLEEWSGRPITNESVREAIAVTNRTRALLQQLADARREQRISGTDALAIIGASAFMPKAEYNGLIEEFLMDKTHQPPLRGPRVFVGGSPQDHTRMYELIEACGATVVAEDHCWGNRLGEFPLDETEDSFEALADRFHRKPMCSIAFPLDSIVSACTQRALAAHVDAAIFWVTRADTGHVWDTPDEIKSLESRGVPSLYLKDQPYAAADAESLQQQIKDFVDHVNA